MKQYLLNDFDLAEYAMVSDECSIWSAPFGLKLLDFVDYKPGISALDIGFGTGFPLTEIALRLGDSSAVYGIDPWKNAIARANEKIKYYRIRNIKIIEGSAESIPLENNSIDLIVSNNGINNVSDINQVVSECSRIIKNGGQFVITVNLDHTMFEFYEQLEKVLSDLQMNNEITLIHKHIYEKRRPLKEMISIIQNHGFIIKDLEHDQFNYRFADGTAMLNHYFIRLAFMG
ncbi:MAG: class I SAM-dependent methyltransferase, partial [Candidatus Gastranaerophilales bacterium]|nr:class I SAM-dependent methyltransferase [Candidatus Gastranaerophilales bacterium]